MGFNKLEITADDFKPFNEWVSSIINVPAQPKKCYPPVERFTTPRITTDTNTNNINIFDNPYMLVLFIVVVVLLFFCSYYSRTIVELKTKYDLLYNLLKKDKIAV
jgi:hypothetical protein